LGWPGVRLVHGEYWIDWIYCVCLIPLSLLPHALY
jgi:hypothetical protein